MAIEAMAAVDTTLHCALQLSVMGKGGAHEAALPVETLMVPGDYAISLMV